MKEIILGILTTIFSGIIQNDIFTFFRVDTYFLNVEGALTCYGFILPWRFEPYILGIEIDFIVFIIDVVVFTIIFYCIFGMVEKIKEIKC